MVNRRVKVSRNRRSPWRRLRYRLVFLHHQPAGAVRALQALPRRLLFLLNAWYFDSLYDAIFVRPAKRLGRFLWKTGDGTVIDGIGPDGVAARVIDITNRVVKLQSGYIYHYAFAMLIGVALLITYFIFAGGGLEP